jgi:starch-binding outer membrane protein, SusD/RagB family
MKTIKKINVILLAFGSLLFASCDKFLDIEPVGRVIPKTCEDFRGVITAGYETVGFDRSLIALSGDEVALDRSCFSFDAFLDVYIWNISQENANAKVFSWQQSYKAILHANAVISEGLKAKEGTPTMVNQLVGEAYMLRAYIHYGLVSLYTDSYGATDPATTPAIPLATEIDLEHVYKRNTVDEVYKQVLSDIEDGIKLLSVDVQPAGFNYRFSKVSAYGFAARVYLSMSNYAKAEEYASKALAISSKLEDFNAKGFVLPYTFKSAENILALEKSMGSSVSKDYAVSQDFLNKYYNAEDLRLSVYYISSPDGVKLKAEDKPEYRVSMRTSELYLVKAEAIGRARGGDLNAAKSVLKVLLKRSMLWIRTLLFRRSSTSVLESWPSKDSGGSTSSVMGSLKL